MKKIMLFLMMIFVGGCLPKYTAPLRMKDYEKEGVLMLPVKNIVLVSEIELPGRLPHVEYQMPMTPEKALRNWAFIRLRADHSKPYTAEFIVKTASMTRESEIKESWFVYDNYKYTLTYDVMLRIVNEAGKEISHVQANGFVMQTLPERASVNERDALFMDMLNHMIDDLNAELSEKVKQKNLAF